MCRYLTTSITSEKRVTIISLDNSVKTIATYLTEMKIISEEKKKKEFNIGNVANVSFDTRYILSLLCFRYIVFSDCSLYSCLYIFHLYETENCRNFTVRTVKSKD